jgi:hypothetical protein
MSDSDPNRPPQGLEQPSAARVLRSLIPNLVINGAFPAHDDGVWGSAFIADALIRAGLTFILSTTLLLVVSPLLFFDVFALTLVLTIAYGKRAQRRGQAQQSS